VTVKFDPRVHSTPADLTAQLNLEMNIGAGMAAAYNGFYAIRDLRASIADRKKALAENALAVDASAALKAFDEKLTAIAIGTQADPGLGPVNRELTRLAIMAQSADTRPSQPIRGAVRDSCQELNKRLAEWRQLNAQEVPPVNALLQKYGQAVLPAVSAVPTDMPCGN
jgi:hypothetical protein